MTRGRGRAAAVAVVATTVGVGLAGVAPDRAADAAAGADATIVGTDFTWAPAEVTVQVGDTVTWTNQQGIHNVLLGAERLNALGFPGDPSWNPPPQRTFTTPGTYSFVCEAHVEMTGTVTVVGEPGEPTPTPTVTPTPTPTPGPVPQPGSGPADTIPPRLGDLALAGRSSSVRVSFSVSEPATLNVRLKHQRGDIVRFRVHARKGTWTVNRPIARGRYRAKLWLVDPMGNRSTTRRSRVTVRG